MQLTFFSGLCLITSWLSTSKAGGCTNPPEADSGFPGDPKSGNLASQPEPNQTANWLCDLSNNNFNNVTPDCFRHLTTATFASFCQALKTPAANNQGFTSTEISKMPSNFINKISAKHVAACKSMTCLKVLARIVASHTTKVPSSSFKEISGAQLKKFYEIARDVNFTPQNQSVKLMAHIPKEVITAYAPAVAAEAKGILKYLPQSTLEALLANPESCYYFGRADIEYLLNNSAIAKSVTSKCMRNLDLNLPQALNNLANTLPKDAFSETNRCLSDQLTAKLTVDHMKVMSSKVPRAQAPGSRVDFTKFGSSNPVAGITSTVFMSRLHYTSGPAKANNQALPSLFQVDQKTNYATKLNKDLFNSLNEDGNIELSLLNSDDIAKMPVALIQSIVSQYPAMCSILPAKNIYSQVKIDNRLCFNQMNPKTQATVLVTAAHLAEDLLTNINKDVFAEWEVPDQDLSKKCGQNCSSLQFFNLVERDKHVADIAKFISHFGEDPDGPNPCIGIGQVEDINKATTFAKYVTSRCFNMEERTFPSDMKGINARLSLLRPYHLLRKEPDFFKNMTEATLKDAISGGSFCYFLEKDNFIQIPKAGLKAMTSKCLLNVSFSNEMTKEHIEVFPPTVFESFPNDQMTPNLIDAMTAAQIPHACTQSADTSKSNLGEILTDAHISSFSTEKVAAISATQWKGCRPEAFKGINEDKLKAIKPDAMAHWTDAQAKVAPKDAWKGLNKEHAAKIGKQVPAGQSPHAYLLGLAEISEEVKKVLKENAPKGEDELKPVEQSGGIPIWAWILGGVLALVVIGAAVYFFFFSS